MNKKEYDAKWYQNNKDKVRKRNKNWAKANPDKMNSYQREYYQRLPILVYRWVSPKGYVAWVGRGTIIRVNEHRVKSRWYESDMFVRTLQARNEWHAMHLEGLWGELFQPRFNKDGYRR